MREGKSFSKDVKPEALRLLNEADKAAAQIAMELGSGEINYINGATNWKQQAMLPARRHFLGEVDLRRGNFLISTQTHYASRDQGSLRYLISTRT